MKLSTFIQVAVLLGLIGFAAIGCASSRQYPDSRRYPYPDSRRYPGDDRTVIIVNPNRLPPGQAKKIYGDQSARRHAPGHNKRYDGRNYDSRRYEDRRYDDRRYDNRRNDRERYSGNHDKKDKNGKDRKR
jgi:hypothetical protein